MLDERTITLVRHGHSAHQQAGWLTASAFERWHTAYDAAGLTPHDRPPEITRAPASRAALVVASDMQRARESAALLAPDAPAKVSALLREVDLPVPRWARWLRLPVAGWIALSRLAWILGARGTESFPAAIARARAAADWLTELAAARGDVVAVTHGGFRRLLAAVLRGRGWRGRAWLASSSWWSAWRFEAPDSPRDAT
jgi:broad specificity phosphatase PhoE